MNTVDGKNKSPNSGNALLNAGLRIITVQVLQYPISDRYCSVGYVATLDVLRSKIRVGGAWFDFDERWIVKPCI